MENAKWHKYIDYRRMKLKYTSLNKIKWGGGNGGIPRGSVKKAKKETCRCQTIKSQATMMHK